MKKKEIPTWKKGIINYDPRLPNPKTVSSIIVDNDEVLFLKKFIDEDGEYDLETVARWGPEELLFNLLELVGYRNVEPA
jgi:hypothetical protein